MKVLVRRKEADAALGALERRARAWSSKTRALRAWGAGHRTGVIVGSGVSAGFLTSFLPIAPLMRLVSALAGTVSLMLEGPFLRLLTAQRHEAANAERAPSTTASR